MTPERGKILFLTGLLINIVFAWWLSYNWLDMIGFSLILVGLYMHKDQLGEKYRYGIWIYYALLATTLAAIFFLWF